MPDGVTLTKARLIELEDDISTKKSGGKEVKVQFNPESLKVSFTNQVDSSDAQGNKKKAAPPRQVFGKGTTKLTLQLWFDVSAQDPAAPGGQAADDVRQLTEQVSYFMLPQEREYGLVPPAVRFLWGTFQFDGVMDSLEETLEFFSPEGRPLRASVSVGVSQPKIDKYQYGQADPRAAGGGGGAKGKGASPQTPGTRPLAQASAGLSFQAMADFNGVGANWQAHASANGIENPRAMTPGQFVSFNSSTSGPASIGFSASASANAGAADQGFKSSVSFNKSS
jgi:hypothetical protein